jgi:hypothetical protein
MPSSAMLSNCTLGRSNLIPDRWIRLTVVSPTFGGQGRLVDVERFFQFGPRLVIRFPISSL